MRAMLSAEAYRAEVGSATPSSMCSPPKSEIGDCDQANLNRAAQTCSFFQETVLCFCQRSMNWQGFIRENLFTRCSIPGRGLEPGVLVRENRSLFFLTEYRPNPGVSRLVREPFHRVLDRALLASLDIQRRCAPADL